MKLYLYITISILVLAFGVWIYNLYQDNKRLQLEKDKFEQNAQALKDSISVMADSLTVTTSFVRDLNNKLDKKTKDYIALQSKYEVVVKKLHVHDTTTSIVTDSTVKVEFSGEQNIVKYNGYTLYDLLHKKSSYELTLSFDPIAVQSEIFKDKDEKWKIRTYSLTSGVDVKGISIIDDKIFASMQKVTEVEKKTFWSHLHFGVGVGVTYTDKVLFYPTIALVWGW
jgi:hypothetical protein